MNKFFGVIICFFIFSIYSAQESILVEKKLIEDYQNLPIKDLIYKDADKGILKEQFTYIDSVNVFAITYLSDGLKVKGFLVEPKAEGNYPAIIFNRGGNRDFGNIVIGMAVQYFGKLAARGYVVVASQYRGNAGGEGEEEFGGKDVNDVLNLFDVLGETPKADTSKIGMFGISRGGLMTLIAATKTDKLKAVVVLGAVSDLSAMIKDRPEMETNVLAEVIPNYEENKDEEILKRSPVKYMEKFPKDVPLLMLHGSSDWRAKPTQAINLAAECDKYRIPYRLIIYEGASHGINEHYTEWMGEVDSWFNRFLKKNEALPNMEFHGK